MGRILIADDHDSLRRGVAQALAEAGHDVEEAPNGNAAIEKLHDIVGSDLVLQTLRVCPGYGPEYNCGRCNKCLRAMIDLLSTLGAPTWSPPHPPRAASRETLDATRLSRGAMIEQLHANYVRTARAKGLLERLVLLRHALPGAMLPVVSYLGPMTSALLATGLVALAGAGAIKRRRNRK